MTAAKTGSDPRKDRVGLTDDQFKHLASLFIAALAFFGTIVAALNVDASARSATADRDSRAFMYQGIADGNEHMLRYGYETNMLIVYQALSTQWGLEMRLAQDKGALPAALDNRSAAVRIAQTAQEQRNLSLILMPPYFDDQTGISNLLQFDAEGQTKLTIMAEKHAARRAEAVAWGQKSDNYTMTLTVLAVSAFLFGLAVIVGGGMGYLFLAVGNLIAMGAAVAVLATLALPVPRLSDQAMQHYARGFGDAYHAQRLEYFTAHGLAIERADLAIASLTQAIRLGGDYAAAHKSRGDAHVIKAQALFFDKSDPARLTAELDQAAVDFRQAIDLGAGDKHTYWNLGYTYFLAKRYPDAIAVSQQALDKAPDLKLALGMNISVYLLGQGKRAEALQQLEQALGWAEKHPLASDWYYMRQIITILEQYQSIQPIDGLPVIEKRIKEAFVSLTYRGTAATKSTGAVIGKLEFKQAELDSNEQFVKYKPLTRFPRGTERVDYGFDFQGMPENVLVVQKIYDGRGNENPTLTRVERWNLSDAGHTDWTIRSPRPAHACRHELRALCRRAVRRG